MNDREYRVEERTPDLWLLLRYGDGVWREAGRYVSEAAAWRSVRERSSSLTRGRDE